MTTVNYIALAVMVVLVVLYVMRRNARVRKEDRD
jgi:hypothetical protein